MATEIIKISNDRYTINGKLLIKKTDGSWIGYDDVTSDELAVFYKHLDSCESSMPKINKFNFMKNLKDNTRLIKGLLIILSGVSLIYFKELNADVAVVFVGAILIIVGIKNALSWLITNTDV